LFYFDFGKMEYAMIQELNLLMVANKSWLFHRIMSLRVGLN